MAPRAARTVHACIVTDDGIDDGLLLVTDSWKGTIAAVKELKLRNTVTKVPASLLGFCTG